MTTKHDRNARPRFEPLKDRVIVSVDHPGCKINGQEGLVTEVKRLSSTNLFYYRVLIDGNERYLFEGSLRFARKQIVPPTV